MPTRPGARRHTRETSAIPTSRSRRRSWALYVQDDIRARKDLTVSVGLRQEYQTHIGGFNIAPRGGIAWSPFKNGKTTIRGGGGVFFDWFDAQAYEQGVQLDGTHQQIETIVQPGYPNPTLGGRALALPAGRVQFAADLAQPRLTEAIAAVEQTLPGDMRLNTMFIHRRGSNQLRGVNVNAPLANGLRPDPDGRHRDRDPVDRASSEFDAISVNLNYQRTPQRLFLAANYIFGRSIDEADSPFALPADTYNLAAERGPALGLLAPSLHEPRQPAAARTASGSARRCACSRGRRTTSRPAATTTATRSATIARPACTRNTGVGRAQSISDCD